MNKRPLNPTHILPKKEKHLKTRIIKRIVLMFQSHDHEEKETLQKEGKKTTGYSMKE